ncbi:uncharacterized protein LOC120713332 [Panicum virgatum]|uniref:uncharacterized protein LOC120713332 n=1 Tax=Panicum virgatum TaxID=38727 RepID=UPI0019D5D7CC|nr:uncharacterized protein LOC120713332 [Panicum virgatum]
MASSSPAAMGELDPSGHGDLDPGAATGELDPGRHGGAQYRPAAASRSAATTVMASSVAAAWRSSTLARPYGELDPGRYVGVRPRPAAAPRLAVGGGDGHGDLGPGGLGELDRGADMGELDPDAMGELNPGGLGEPASP